jgi:hypothetical protein
LRSHPAFQEIFGLGEAVVPLMLRDLEERPRLWVWALPRITGADPVPASDRGNIAKMSAAWVHWGREHRYRMVERLDRALPALRGSGYRVTSPQDHHYKRAPRKRCLIPPVPPA